MTATSLNRNPGAALAVIKKTPKRPIVITHHNRKIAVLLDYEEYQRLVEKSDASAK